jgi:hypothetical protein
MTLRITERSKHSKDVAVAHQTLKRKFVSAIKSHLRVILLRPATWHTLIVNLPELGEKTEGFIRQVTDFFTDLFTGF